MLFAALSVLNDPVDQVLLIAVVALRKENILRAVGNTTPESDISGISSHNLDDTAALVGGGSITDFIDGFHRCVYSGIETDRIIGTGDIKVNGSRKTDRVDSESRKAFRHRGRNRLLRSQRYHRYHVSYIPQRHASGLPQL